MNTGEKMVADYLTKRRRHRNDSYSCTFSDDMFWLERLQDGTDGRR